MTLPSRHHRRDNMRGIGRGSIGGTPFELAVLVKVDLLLRVVPHGAIVLPCVGLARVRSRIRSAIDIERGYSRIAELISHEFSANAEGKAVRPCHRLGVAAHPEGEREARTDCRAKAGGIRNAPRCPVSCVHGVGCPERGVRRRRGDVACRIRTRTILVAPEVSDKRTGSGVDLGGRAEGRVRRVKVPAVGHFASGTGDGLGGLELREPLHLLVRRRIVEERKLVEAGAARVGGAVIAVVELPPHRRADVELLEIASAEEVDIRDMLSIDVERAGSD